MGAIDIDNANRPPVETIVNANLLSSPAVTVIYQLWYVHALMSSPRARNYFHFYPINMTIVLDESNQYCLINVIIAI